MYTEKKTITEVFSVSLDSWMMDHFNLSQVVLNIGGTGIGFV
jgi:hypothetical protein